MSYGNLNHSPSSLICAQKQTERRMKESKLNVAYQQIQSIFSRIENQMWVRQQVKSGFHSILLFKQAIFCASSVVAVVVVICNRFCHLICYDYIYLLAVRFICVIKFRYVFFSLVLPSPFNLYNRKEGKNKANEMNNFCACVCVLFTYIRVSFFEFATENKPTKKNKKTNGFVFGYFSFSLSLSRRLIFQFSYCCFVMPLGILRHAMAFTVIFNHFFGLHFLFYIHPLSTQILLLLSTVFGLSFFPCSNRSTGDHAQNCVFVCTRVRCY